MRRTLGELHAAEATADLWRRQKPLLAQAAQLVDLQVKAGEVSPLEAAQARITLNRAELAARESDRAVALARSRLAEAIGVPLAALPEVTLSYRGLDAASVPFDAGEARRWAAQNRADLLAALATYAASQSAVARARIMLTTAEKTRARQTQLRASDGTSERAMQEAEERFASARGELAAAHSPHSRCGARRSRRRAHSGVSRHRRSPAVAGGGARPHAYGIGSGADMLKPLAIAVIGALCTSVLLSLVATPTVYFILRRGGERG